MIRIPMLVAVAAILAAGNTVCAQIVRSAMTGDWSAPATWDSGKVPGAGARVLIRTGHTVRYDANSADVIRVIHVAGTFKFADNRNTRLDVGLIRIQTGDTPSEEGFDCEGHLDIDETKPRPALEIGTANAPIPSKHTALIRLHYLKGMDAQSCPAIVCCGGRMDIHGSPMPRTWLPLDTTAKKGDNLVTLSEPAKEWKPGDRLIVTATRGNHDGDRETEVRLIQSIDGKKLTLDRALTYNHNVLGEFRGVVGNLSRNVVIESADSRGVRGHTMYHRNSQGAISYAELRHLGKENVLGRYAIHYHLVGNTMRGSYVLGASIWDSHNRWITVHGTNHLIVRDCIGYRSIGHGIYLEDGTEILNVFDRNLCVQALRGKKLPKQAIPFDENEGAGFWWANSLNAFTNNVTCENGRYGYRFEATPTASYRLTQPVLFPDGKRRELDLRCLPFVRFENNESHADGRYGFNLGEGVEGVGPNSNFPFVIRNMKIWETHYAFRPQSPAVLVDGMKIKHCEYGIYHPHYERHVYKNLHISDACDEPFNRGHDDDDIQLGSATVDGLTFENVGNQGWGMIQLTGSNPTGDAAVHIRNLKVIHDANKNKRPLVDLGGSAKPEPKTASCVPVYIHDLFGEGRHGKFVTIKSDHLRRERLTYRSIPLFTGAEARVAEVRDTIFPKLLDPVDDFPPTTVITHIHCLPSPSGRGAGGEGGTLIVRGTTCDNGKVVKVMVNDVPAKSTRANFSEWEATLTAVNAGTTIRAHAEDAAGNREVMPHVVPYSEK